MQFENARAAHLENLIPARTLLEELKRIADEPSPSEVARAFEQDGMWGLFSPALSGAKLNLPALARLEKAERLVESANTPPASKLGPFLSALTAKLTPKEKSGLIKPIEIPKAEIEVWRSLEPRTRKLEQALKSPRVRKPSPCTRYSPPRLPTRWFFCSAIPSRGWCRSAFAITCKSICRPCRKYPRRNGRRSKASQARRNITVAGMRWWPRTWMSGRAKRSLPQSRSP